MRILPFRKFVWILVPGRGNADHEQSAGYYQHVARDLCGLSCDDAGTIRRLRGVGWRVFQRENRLHVDRRRRPEPQRGKPQSMVLHIPCRTRDDRPGAYRLNPCLPGRSGKGRGESRNE